MSKTTLGQILARAPAANVAFQAPDRPPLNYGDLRDFVFQIGGALRVAGVSGADRVAFVLPNGPAMATAFLACAILERKSSG